MWNKSSKVNAKKGTSQRGREGARSGGGRSEKGLWQLGESIFSELDFSLIAAIK